MGAEWAQRHGMEVTETYKSVGQDDMFLDLMNDVAAGKVVAVVATKSDRYSRRAAKLKALTEIARKHAVQVFTVELDDLDLTSATGDFRLTMLGLFDDYEKERARAEETVRKPREWPPQLRALRALTVQWGELLAAYWERHGR